MNSSIGWWQSGAEMIFAFGDRTNSSRDVSGDMECAEAACDNEAAVRLHVPWTKNREVCAAHARGLVQREGVVAEPLEGAEWP